MRIEHFILVIWTFLTLSASAANSPRHVFTFHFEVENEAYSLHIVVPHFLSLSKNDLNDFVTAFLRASPRGNVSEPWRNVNVPRFIQKWVLKHYRDIGLLPKDPTAELSAALERTSYFDIARSGAAFVTPRGSRKILALVRIDADSETETQLGLEQFLIEMGHHTAPFARQAAEEYVERFEKNDYRLLLLPNGHFQFGWVRRKGVEPKLPILRPPGAAAEMLNFNLVKGSYDFLPLLYLAIEAFGLSKWSGKKTSADSGSELLGIDDYYMHCEGEVRRNYFVRRGWKVIDTYPNPHLSVNGVPVTNYVLTISRHDFKFTLERTFTGRETFVNFLLARFELDESLRNQARCRSIISDFGAEPWRLGPPPKLILPDSATAAAVSATR